MNNDTCTTLIEWLRVTFKCIIIIAIIIIIITHYIVYLPRWLSRLRHCATSQKVAGSIPDGVTGIFH